MGVVPIHDKDGNWAENKELCKECIGKLPGSIQKDKPQVKGKEKQERVEEKPVDKATKKVKDKKKPEKETGNKKPRKPK